MKLPELARQVGDLFDHVLVDEYQDTNALQASILLGLKPDGRGLTVVGDVMRHLAAVARLGCHGGGVAGVILGRPYHRARVRGRAAARSREHRLSRRTGYARQHGRRFLDAAAVPRPVEPACDAKRGGGDGRRRDIIVLLVTLGDVSVLVVLYTINVFLTFSLSLASLVRYWWRHRGERRWNPPSERVRRSMLRSVPVDAHDLAEIRGNSRGRRPLGFQRVADAAAIALSASGLISGVPSAVRRS
jgi:hypothetical protein